MVFLVGIAAAFALGLGWVLQQRVAAHAALSELLSFRLLLHLMHKRVWWLGILAMVTGQALGGLAFDLGSVTLIEPLLSTNLLFAFILAACLNHQRVHWREVCGAILLSAALGVFIAVGNPRAGHDADVSLLDVAIAVSVVAVVVAALVVGGRNRRLLVESILFATGAGVLYGLQDVSTRASLLRVDSHGVGSLVTSPWGYLVVVSAVIGLLLSQSAFRAARLDYSLPPTAAAEPIVGVALGVGLLGDVVSVSIAGLAVECCCLVAMVAGVVMIGRSGALAHHVHHHIDRISR